MVIVFESMRRHVRNFPYLGELLSHELDERRRSFLPLPSLSLVDVAESRSSGEGRNTVGGHQPPSRPSIERHTTPDASSLLCGIRRKF